MNKEQKEELIQLKSSSASTACDDIVLFYTEGEPIPRKDAFGSEIKKGGKTHKVSFVDNLPPTDPFGSSNKLIDLVLIKSYKRYNVPIVVEQEAEIDKDDGASGKSCLVF